ncbi:fluoride efflux transporter CrcB [Caldicellulosiruptor changbaiensis]|uniref:Fluoride-specific ion channel FluC n=2 Tax=Caldicellulosiruptor TaxID=44000 RepID=A0A3T0D7S4_9FIRM|nr:MULTISPECIES: fluoride efflux transporter CrcB [Caldicellulosiruptor]AZT91221.1 fluoride efflux transporter CrcB [Caldicellulosiruptor changbaiensis]WAM31944.1 fluoride efflux transporter CrcB [Caldicellulosiruptor naganoensis]
MKNIAAISVGAFFGAISRYLISQLYVADFPTATLFINVLGSFALCFVAQITIDHIKIKPAVRHMITTGFISSFTTFSTFIIEIIKLISKGEAAKAFVYPVLSILLGLFAALLGYEAAEFVAARRQKEEVAQEV